MELEPPNGFLLCFYLNFLVWNQTLFICSKESSHILPPNFGTALICFCSVVVTFGRWTSACAWLPLPATCSSVALLSCLLRFLWLLRIFPSVHGHCLHFFLAMQVQDYYLDTLSYKYTTITNNVSTLLTFLLFSLQKQGSICWIKY